MDDSTKSTITPILIGGFAVLLFGSLMLGWGAPEEAPPAKRKSKKEIAPTGESIYRTDFYAKGDYLVDSETEKGTLRYSMKLAKTVLDRTESAEDPWTEADGPKPVRWTITDKKTNRVVARGNRRTQRISS